VQVMTPSESAANGAVLYQGQIPCTRSGRYGFTARVVPRHDDLAAPRDTRLVRWG
jgi:starch phosphorylase